MESLVQAVTTDRKTLREVAKAWRVPYGRLAQWIVEDGERTAQYEAALRIVADELALEAVAIADDRDPDVGRDKLRVDTRLKLASKLYRDRYGEKVKVEHQGAPAADAGLITAASELLRLVVKREPRVVEAEVVKVAEPI
jgi:hypothetical protein